MGKVHREPFGTFNASWAWGISIRCRITGWSSPSIWPLAILNTREYPILPAAPVTATLTGAFCGKNGWGWENLRNYGNTKLFGSQWWYLFRAGVATREEYFNRDLERTLEIIWLVLLDFAFLWYLLIYGGTFNWGDLNFIAKHDFGWDFENFWNFLKLLYRN